MVSDRTSLPVEFELDEHGRVIRPNCHDATLAKFSYEISKEMQLLAVRSDSSRVQLCIGDVIDAQVTLWAGVIISEIFVWKIAEVPVALRNVPDSGWNGLFRERLFERNREAEMRRIVAAYPDAYLFEMQASYGGSISCVASRISISLTDQR